MIDYSYSICCPGSYIIKRFTIHKQAISNSDLAEPKRVNKSWDQYKTLKPKNAITVLHLIQAKEGVFMGFSNRDNRIILGMLTMLSITGPLLHF